MLKRPVRPVITAALLFCFALLLYRLSCGTRTRTRSERPAGEDAHEALLQQHERQYLLYTANLTKQIWQLKKDLKQRSVIFPPDPEERSRSELEEFMRNQLRRAEVGSGEQLQNEFAVLPFDSFTLRRVYQLETGLTGHPVETPLRRDRRNELNGALEAALHLLNQPQAGDSQNRRTYSPQHFYEGIFRTERDKGTLYDLAFRENSVPDFRRLVFFRPFAPLMKVKEEFMDTSQILINIIVPLAGRVDAFRQFMHRFSEVCIGQDGRTHLTVVFFGSEKMDEVKGILDVISRRMKYRNVTLIRLNEAFSRARGLDVGAHAWKRSNVLLFFCDVNVHFTADFLNSCRMNAQPGGFDASVKGSASEDVRLYRKFLRSSLLVVRAPSRGLFHVWHQTLCHAHLSTETFKLCLQSKALNEASHSQLGLMNFHQQINNHLLKYNQS
ncbi:Chondroitin sulfate N-acetylgalactosaminyltransferase 1 [Anabarilius grahami]|uniref:Hexosyltransferase n=1 Tax=Anabarilius grahami TaxID=495550 RepID=A0A3N0Z631_ANAGA|nr:Chondroitin sulfate N-acetylgalactosaminyltransferase 1 [Anabarilius grahami]